MKIKSITLGGALVILLFGGIMISSVFGWWQTESNKVPAKIKEGEAAGEYNPEDIRGSYGFIDISEHFEIPLETLADAFMLPNDVDPSLFKNKDLEVLYEEIIEEDKEIGNASVQLFVALYKGLPFGYDEDI